MNKVVVVIPIYKTDLDDNEMISLKRSVKILGKHPFAIACPEHIDLKPLEPILKPISYTVKRFDNSYFKGISGYNRLMLSEVLSLIHI